MQVDAALCDLGAGEVHLATERWEDAERCFTRALPILSPLPDQLWRAHYGCARCAEGCHDKAEALRHYLFAVDTIRRGRAVLPAERLSSSYFVSRRDVYHDALTLAMAAGAFEEALRIVEASKAQSFLARIGRADAEVPASKPASSHVARLQERERDLRREIQTLRQQLIVQETAPPRPVVRSGTGGRADRLSHLERLASEYEAVVERLRLRSETQRPPAFSLDTFREVADTSLPPAWAALAYYFLDDTLFTFYLDAERLRVYTRELNAYDRMALRQCTSLEADFRELIYRGTIRGYPAPNSPGRTYRRHLHTLLIPPEVDELPEEGLLVVAPHGPLHWLPFQALLDGDVPLIAQFSLITVPTLSTLPTVAERGGTEALTLKRTLVCGLTDFGKRARPLPQAAEEVAALEETLGDRLQVLWEKGATKTALQEMSARGELADFGVVHFATHAVLDGLAPSQSRLLLADDDLTVVDVAGLDLSAGLVVLSTCEGAAGHMTPGDEVMGLARAFFGAGVGRVVASLWPVEDSAAREMARRLYRRLDAGDGVARALRQAQLDMMRDGWAPYQWAPFVVIGMP